MSPGLLFSTEVFGLVRREHAGDSTYSSFGQRGQMVQGARRCLSPSLLVLLLSVTSPASCWSFVDLTGLPLGFVRLLFIKLHYSLTI